MSTQHFTGEQLSQWVAGDKPTDLVTHLEGCSECLAQVAHFESLLMGFHDGIHAAVSRAPIPAFEPPRAVWQVTPRWVLAGAVVAVLAAVPFYRSPTPAPSDPTPVVVAEVSDAQLLEQINTQLARHVPGPLEPLEAFSYSPLEELSKGKNQ